MPIAKAPDHPSPVLTNYTDIKRPLSSALTSLTTTTAEVPQWRHIVVFQACCPARRSMSGWRRSAAMLCGYAGTRLPRTPIRSRCIGEFWRVTSIKASCTNTAEVLIIVVPCWTFLFQMVEIDGIEYCHRLVAFGIFNATLMFLITKSD